ANPIGITIMAIAGAAFLIYKYWEPIKAFFTGLWDKIKQAFAAARDAINNVITHWRPLALIKSVLLGGLGKLTHELVDKFKSLGSSIVGGIASGIKGAAGTAKNAVTNVASGTAGWFADKLGIRSPSRVFRDFGLHTIEGYRQGLQRGQRRLRHQLDTLGGAIAPGPALTFDRRAPATAPPSAAPPPPPPPARPAGAPPPLPRRPPAAHLSASTSAATSTSAAARKPACSCTRWKALSSGPWPMPNANAPPARARPCSTG